MCMEFVSGIVTCRNNRLPSSDSRNSSLTTTSQQQQRQRQRQFEDSLDLFANDDEALERQKRIGNRSSESDLRHYYKSRLQGRKSQEIDRRMIDNSANGGNRIDTDGSSSSGSYESKKTGSFQKSRESPHDNSLASEILKEDPNNPMVYNRTDSFPNRHHEGEELEISQECSSVDVFTDDEGESWQTSTPAKDGGNSSALNNGQEDGLVWVAPDTNW